MEAMTRLPSAAAPIRVHLIRPLLFTAALVASFCSAFSAAAQSYPIQQQEFIQTYEKCRTDLRAQNLEIVAERIVRGCAERLERIASNGLHDWQGITSFVTATESHSLIEIYSRPFRSPTNVVLREQAARGISPVFDAEHESLVKQLVTLNLQPEQRVVFSATLAEPISFAGQQENILRLAVKGVRLRRP